MWLGVETCALGWACDFGAEVGKMEKPPRVPRSRHGTCCQGTLMPPWGTPNSAHTAFNGAIQVVRGRPKCAHLCLCLSCLTQVPQPNNKRGKPSIIIVHLSFFFQC